MVSRRGLEADIPAEHPPNVVALSKATVAFAAAPAAADTIAVPRRSTPQEKRKIPDSENGGAAT